MRWIARAGVIGVVGIRCLVALVVICMVAATVFIEALYSVIVLAFVGVLVMLSAGRRVCRGMVGGRGSWER